ncbi:MAG TPA: hypothetical protein VGP68_23855, partial [Gemmataceae bacterium]|nr:hypothetical protein [Gemmataceae bacterium]
KAIAAEGQLDPTKGYFKKAEIIDWIDADGDRDLRFLTETFFKVAPTDKNAGSDKTQAPKK